MIDKHLDKLGDNFDEADSKEILEKYF